MFIVLMLVKAPNATLLVYTIAMLHGRRLRYRNLCTLESSETKTVPLEIIVHPNSMQSSIHAGKSTVV